MVARSHQDMEAPSHSIRCMAIPSTARGTEPAVIGAAAEVGADITGMATVGTVNGTADMVAAANMQAEADMEAEAAMVAADDTFSLSDSIRSLTFRVEFNPMELRGAGSCQRR